ncbi:hypothetical protein [Novosphingobium rosa]|uniref:hypothetical protein n=1 Tax=Novosphingobium rosa TaxID=76978 RepID=UPI00082F5584|nr:hypothetical protein [Novosphingobium rosa]
MQTKAQRAARKLISPGPVADQFIRSRAFICGIIGPVGSGKTMAALQKALRIAAQQLGVVDDNGIIQRKARIGVIRESYPSIDSTILKSWFNIVPKEEGKFSAKAPYTHIFRKILKRNPETGQPTDILNVEIEFRAIGDQSVEMACRGWEVNVVVVDEADIQPADLVPFLTGRVGRFSDLDPSLVVDPTIILSLNMPDIENHIYVLLMDRDLSGLSDEDKAELEKALNGRPLIDCFVQPGGREPDAENLHNLPGGRGYYILQVAANQHKPGYVDRMVDNKPVPIMYGLPVNPDFVHREHVASVMWDKRRKLIFGVDQGLFAAAVLLYRNELGQIRVLGEVVNLAPDGKSLLKVGPTAFGKKCRNFLMERFPGLHPDQIRVVGDPAMFAANDREDDEQDWRLAFQKALGFPVFRAKSNRQGLRNEAIWRAHKERGGYRVDPCCRTLIKAHVGGYRYAKQTLSTGETKANLEIAETIYHNVADAEQYAALEGENVIAEIRGHVGNAQRKVTVVTDYDPFSTLN